MTLIAAVDASVLVSKLSRLDVLFSSKIFLPIYVSCILRVTSNKTNEAFSKSLSIVFRIVCDREFDQFNDEMYMYLQ